MVKHAYITVVRRGDDIFKLLGSEDINPNKVALSMTVLPSIGSRNFINLPTEEGKKKPFKKEQINIHEFGGQNT